jgi:hypothetical protein
MRVRGVEFLKLNLSETGLVQTKRDGMAVELASFIKQR